MFNVADGYGGPMYRGELLSTNIKETTRATQRQGDPFGDFMIVVAIVVALFTLVRL